LNVADSAAYYYEKALEIMPDRNSILYRDVIVSMALLNSYHDAENSLDSLKRMAALSENEMERLNRFLTIGAVYQSVSQYDSAKVYLEPVFERDPDRVIIAARYLREIALIEGDTLKANQYSQVLAEDAAAAPGNLFRASQLNDLFQNYLQEKQETALALERQEARRRNLWIGGGVALLAIVGLAVAIVTRRSHKKRLAAQEAEAQRRLDEASKRLSEASQQLTEASQRHDETERELQTKVEQAAQHTREVLEKRVMGIYMTGNGDRLERIFEDFESVYPHAVEKLEARHPELTEQERNVVVLSFLRFRAKEIAELLGLTEGTVQKYRSNIRKKVGNDPISEAI
jgi:DNA-binding NarL/FixJ family response regulator